MIQFYFQFVKKYNDSAQKAQLRTSQQASRYNARMVRQAHHERAHPEPVEGYERI
ncbi:MAG: hypothetical protein US13_C0010G0054 [candidate division TM6 bacterium GW2011_GWE2_36_25]|nr:MAG: hypothetical protein US03_C0010G0021 [candidate division TM6 bacterium GW2011_GWF2_36_131]KKQ02792.1 MAG: hypothetical protein US13_C0010G0054 [candidate division TM6 bacterium GW2011_GWE2_36_25]KKQ18143.1 MAG: hypothetical protein US32_C0030G0010 [candidate division TM6 bacterium GW2011_GWA2_36_9]